MSAPDQTPAATPPAAVDLEAAIYAPGTPARPT